MKKWVIPTALVAALFAGAGPAAAAPPDGKGPPTSLDGVVISRHCGLADAGFEVTGVLSGSFKDILLPNGTILSASPGLKVKLTTDAGKTVSYVITGVTRTQKFSDRTEVVATGKNLITRPDIDPGPAVVSGLYLITGNFNFANKPDPDGSELRAFSGTGTVIDVCALLAP
jgi:hypothetical protein